MFTSVINKQSFEFFCTSETTAALVRSDIELYTIKQFNAIIESVFLEINANDQLLKIDKIEINLGDIAVGGMRTPEVFSNFRRMLTEKINDASNINIDKKIIGNSTIDYSGIDNIDAINYGNKVYGNNAASHIKTEDNNGLIYSDSTGLINVDADCALSVESQRELELIQSFIANGELPWWVNKNNEFIINETVQSVIHNHSENLKKLLQEFTQTPELVSRLFAELLPATVLEITKLLADISSDAIGDNPTQHGNLLNSNSAFEEQIEKFRKVFESYFDKPIEKDKKHTQEITDLLTEIVDKGLWPEMFNNLHGIAQLKPLINNSSFITAHERRLEIEQTVELLSVFEKEFLLFELAKHNVGAKSIKDHTTELDSSVVNYIAATVSEYPTENNTSKQNASETFTAKSASNILPRKLPNVGTYKKPDVDNKSLDVVPLNKENNDGALLEQASRRDKKIDNVAIYFDAAKILEGDVDNTLADGESVGQKMLLLQKDEKAYDIDYEKAIAFIMRKLKSTDAALYVYLQFLSIVELQKLVEAFKQRVIEKNERLQAVKKILNHPYLFKYNIVGVLVHLLASEKSSASRKTDGAATQSMENNGLANIAQEKLLNKSESLSNLYEPEAINIFVIKDVLKKRGFDTENEKNIIKKTLYSLAEESFNFLKFLTELPVNEIEKMPPITGYEYKQDSIFFDNPTLEKKTYIDNAGLCLLAPYLPSFLKRLKYLENGKFKNKHIAVRAIYILQYLVSTKNKSPEYLLQFNKLLCGFKIEEPILSRVNLTKNEKLEADNLIASVIQNWKVLKSTSSKGLRESFLQRKGILLNEGKSWTLRVEKKAYDILLDSIPWNYTMIKFAWMEKMVLVEW